MPQNSNIRSNPLMTRPRMPLADLLAQHPIDLSALEPAPTAPSRAEVRARVERIHLVVGGSS